MDRAIVAPPYARPDGYAALGLLRNPFAAEQQPGVAGHLWIARDDEPPLPTARSRRIVQLIGPKGAGKTSLLLRWSDQRPGPYHYVAPGLSRWRMPPIAALVYWDELDRLAAPIRMAALMAATAIGATVVAGTHRNLAVCARRCGLRVTTYRFAPISAALLRAWADRRIDQARDPAAPLSIQLDSATARRIATQAGASWREAGVLLHMWAAEQAAAI